MRQILLTLLVPLSLNLFGQVVEITSPPGDKEFGEEEQIRARDLWFVTSRGLDQVSRPDLKLRAALESVKAELANRRGTPGQGWYQTGPAPMTMLSWAMGKVAGRVSSFAYDPDDVETLYLGTASGGVWKSTDGGTSWKSIFDAVGTQSIGSVFVQASPNKRIWVGTGEQGQSCTSYFGLGLWVSHDEGDSFVEANGSGANRLEASFITAIAVSASDPDLLLAGGEGYCDNGSNTTGGLFRTTDAGQTWTEVLTGRITDIAYHPDNPTTYYAALSRGSDVNGGVYRSEDSGQTWTRLENGILSGSGFGRSRLAIAPSDPQTLYALVNRGSVYLYKSVDGGDSWTTQNTNACEGQCSYNLCISVHPTSPETLLIGTIRHSRSTNSGVTLTPLTSGWGSGQSVHQDTHVVYYDRGGTGRAADPNLYWVGTDGGLWKTENGGSSYQHLNEGLNIAQFYDVEVHPDSRRMIFGGAQDNSSTRGNDSTEWNVTVVTGDGFMNAIDPNNPNIVFQNSYPQGSFPNIARSNSGGAPNTFSFIGTTGMTGGPFPWVTPMDISYDGNTSALFVGSDRIFRSTNSGNNWTGISGDLSNGSINILNSEFINGKIVVLAGTQDGRIHRSPDAMAASPIFEEITSNYPGGNVSDVAVDPTNVDRLYVTRAAFGLNKLYRTSNGGTTWDPVGNGLPDVPANSVAIDPLDGNRVFVGNDIGVFLSTNAGDSFLPFMNGMPLGAVVTDLEIDDDPYVLTAGTYGRGAWQFPLSGPLTLGTENIVTCEGAGVPLMPTIIGGLEPLAFSWLILSGPDTAISQLSDPNSANPSFSPSTTGSYLLQLTVTDEFDTSLSVEMTVSSLDSITFVQTQRTHWLRNSSHPEWVPGFDRNNDNDISIQDFILELNNPTCQVANL